jgi:general secretion pathway protein J
MLSLMVNQRKRFIHQWIEPQRRSISGFTLIEMLVVMVILALTTSLLTQGLSTTWRNFERLSARDIINSSAQLPLSWFEQSLAAALLYHPAKILVRGEAKSFEFVSFASPDDEKHIPQRLIWRIEAKNEKDQNLKWSLTFQSETSPQLVTVASFLVAPSFEYWDGNSWLAEFLPTDGRLPQAVRIMLGDQIWAMAKPQRPYMADMPVELPFFGAYEF